MKTFVSRYPQRIALAMICATLLLPLCFVQAQERQSDQQFDATKTTRQTVILSAASGMTMAPPTGRFEVSTSEESNALVQVWHPWVAIAGPPGEKSFCRPSAAGRPTGEVSIVDITQNGDVWHRWSGIIGSWSAWEPLGQPPVGTSLFDGPSIAARRNGIVDVFVIGIDGNIWHRWWSASTGWTPWGSIGRPLGNDVQVIGIAATGRASGELDVIVTDNTLPLFQTTRVWHKWWSASTGWSGWGSLGELGGFGSFITQPTVAGRKSGELDVFIASNGTPRHKWWSASTGWSPWGSLDGIVTGLAAAGRATGLLDLVGNGTDGGIWHKWWVSGSGWHPWGSLGLSFSNNVSEPCIAAPPDGQLYVFVKQLDSGNILIKRWG